MGRPKSIYDWEGKRDEFYDLYIIQDKSMDEVMERYAAEGGFMPRLVLTTDMADTASQSTLTAITSFWRFLLQVMESG